ncbi:hypothetical protein GOODEAATRI_010177 [Goodea atripinnis]|uniref:Uncharacterized protein n=1 Tax=Goodea atripinnis TaxID=208336 RepID=A0ABV0PCX3_9TELE
MCVTLWTHFAGVYPYKSSTFSIFTTVMAYSVSLLPFCPHFSSLSQILSVYDGQISWGKTVGRMQGCCHGNYNPPSPSGLLSNKLLGIVVMSRPSMPCWESRRCVMAELHAVRVW